MPESCPAFAELAEALCSAVGTTLPPLMPDTAGGFGFRLQIDDVAVSVTHYPVHFPEHAFVLVAFGPVPTSAEADVFRELLNANLMMLRPGAPAFARDPLDGQIVLQASCALAETSADALLTGIRVAVGKAMEWRQAHSLTPSPDGGSRLFGTSFA